MNMIGPVGARDILEHYEGRRMVAWSKIFVLQQRIERGLWIPGQGAPIEINTTTGDLVDGQHRLIAIAMAGKIVAVEMRERR